MRKLYFPHAEDGPAGQAFSQAYLDVYDAVMHAFGVTREVVGEEAASTICGQMIELVESDPVARTPSALVLALMLAREAVRNDVLDRFMNGTDLADPQGNINGEQQEQPQ